MSWLSVPKQRAGGSGTGQTNSVAALDRVAADIVVAQARAASKLASQTGALKAYLDFEKTAEEKRVQGRRPVHNERFLGNTLKQINAHNRRQLPAAAGSDSHQVSRGGATTSNREPPSAGPTKVKVVFESEGTLGIFFERNTLGEAVIKAIRPGGLAERFSELRTGMVLSTVQGVKVSNLGYTHALDLMKGSERPLALKFRDPAAKEAKQRLKQRKKEHKRERKRRRSEKYKASKRHRDSRDGASSAFGGGVDGGRLGGRDSGRDGDSIPFEPFVEGERVLYCGRSGQEEEVVIVSVDNNVAVGDDPFVAVRMPSGTVRDTTFERLRKLDRSA